MPMTQLADNVFVSPLADNLPYGAKVTGLVLDHLSNEDIRKKLVDLWIDRGVMLFCEGDDTGEMQLELSRVFGDLVPFPYKESRDENQPDLVKIKYFPEDGTCYNINGQLTGGWVPWHTDLVYTAEINHGGILRPHQLSETGGQTGFIDQIAAYDALSDEMKAQIEDLHVVYVWTLNLSQCKFLMGQDVKFVRGANSMMKIMEREYQYPRVMHPLVFTQKETGRKVLNISPGFASGIYEMGGPKGEALLEELINHCLKPEFTYMHQWNYGEMVLWDNWRVLHCATGVPADQTRVMHRTTIFGDYGLGQVVVPSQGLPRVEV